MNLRYKQKVESKERSSILSATKPKTGLSLKEEQKKINLRTHTKSVLKVYVDEEANKKYVEVAAAYALGLTNVRAIMTSTRYKEITNEKIEQIRQRGYDVEFINLLKKEKQKIQIFYKDNLFYISSGAAYALGYIDVEKFNLEDNLYGPLKDEEFKNIKNTFAVEFSNIKNINENLKVK